MMDQATFEDRCLDLYEHGADVQDISNWARTKHPTYASRRLIQAVLHRARNRRNKIARACPHVAASTDREASSLVPPGRLSQLS